MPLCRRDLLGSEMDDLSSLLARLQFLMPSDEDALVGRSLSWALSIPPRNEIPSGEPIGNDLCWVCSLVRMTSWG